jgi:aryl-alcohol dehydrogenase-like predicted oxidoreductase
MEYQTLGRRGPEVSRIGFGCWAAGGHGYGEADDAASTLAMRRALELGITLFDTADVYGFGHSEEILAKALGSARRDVVIATKFGVRWDDQGKTVKDCSPHWIRAAVEGSLRRLQLDTIPLYQIHWHDGVTPLASILETLEDLRARGKIRHIGCSNFPLPLLQESGTALETLQCEYSVAYDFEPGIASFVSQREMGVLVYNVLLRGLLSGKFDQSARFGTGDTRSKDKDFAPDRIRRHLDTARMLGEIGVHHGCTAAQVAIRHALDHPAVTSAIVGAKSAAQVESNVAAVALRLESGETAALRGRATTRTARDA